MKKILTVSFVVWACLLATEPPLEQIDLNFIFRQPYLYGTMPQSVAWSPNDSMLAFLWNDQGNAILDLWFADLSNNKIERLTNFALNREQVALGELTWTPDNRQLIFTLQGDIYCFQLMPEHQMKRLTHTEAIETGLLLSPDGKYLAFWREEQLILFNLKSGEERSFEVLASDFKGSAPEIAPLLRWSPSSRQLAVVLPQPQDLALPLKIIDLPANQIKEIAFIGKSDQIGTIRELCWAADEKQLAIDMMSRGLTGRHIGIIDFTRSRLDTIYQEKAQNFFTGLNQRLFWLTAEQKLLFSSEQNGYHHLYFLNLATRRAEALTRGQWHVFDYQLDTNHNVVYFTANRDNQHAAQLYMINLKTFQTSAISYIDGCYQFWLSVHGDKIAEIFSNSTTPPDLYWIETKPKYRMNRLTTSPAPIFKQYQLRKPIEQSIRNQTSGQNIVYRAWYPDVKLAGVKYPIVMVLNAQNALYPTQYNWSQTDLFQQWLSTQGVIVVEVEYTAVAQAQSLVQNGLFTDLASAQISDILTVLETVGKQDFVDINRVGIFGWGYGGYLATMALLKEPQWFKAGGAVNALLDQGEGYSALNAIFAILRGSQRQFMALDPLAFSNYLGGKYFLAQGKGNCLPALWRGEELAQQMLWQGKLVDWRCYPWDRARFDREEVRYDVFSKLANFFKTSL